MNDEVIIEYVANPFIAYYSYAIYDYTGKVIGLGSRIVEIPSRLRKIEAIKAYGREVLIEISKENCFLQNEKVSIKFIPEAPKP